MSKVIKQTDKVSCMACVACMATNTGPEDFRRYFHFFCKGPPYSDLDLYRYLLSQGYAFGIGFRNDRGYKFRPKNKLRIEFNLKDFPAYVIVKSQRFKGVTHAVYWDGEKILDPNPTIEGDGLPLEKYEILSWFPIVQFWVNGKICLKSKEVKDEGKI